MNFHNCKVIDQEVEIFGLQIPRFTALSKLSLEFGGNQIRKNFPRLGYKIAQLNNLLYLKVNLSDNALLDHDTCHLFIEQLSSTVTLECMDLQFRNVPIPPSPSRSPSTMTSSSSSPRSSAGSRPST